MPATLPQVRSRIERTGGADAQRLAAFADGLFAKADDAFLAHFDPDALHALARDSYAFLDGLGGEGCRVEAFNPDARTHGWDAPYSVVRLALVDRPFIVDSVRSELRRQGFEMAFVLHPIYAVTRDDDGRIVALGERTGSERREAFEIYLVDREEDPARLEALRRAVARVLGDVILATDDYAAMRERAAELAGYLRELRRRSAHGPLRGRGEELEEYAAFVEWLVDDNFVFLGYREYDLVEVGGEPSLRVTPDSGLGLLRKVGESAYREPVPVSELPAGLRERVLSGPLVVVTKTNAESTVHRPARMDYVGIKRLGPAWEALGEQRFIGLLTSKAHFTAADRIPVLRRKMRRVLELDAAIPGSHDYKQIVEIFNSMPRPDLFWASGEDLHTEIRAIMSLEQERGIRLILRPDPLSRGLAAMVVLPRDRFNATVRRRIQDLLSRALSAAHVDYQLAMGEDEAGVRMHFFFTTSTPIRDVDVKGLEAEVAELARTWEDHLRERLVATVGEVQGRRLAERYLLAFEDRYTADTPAARAVHDIEHLEALGDGPVRVDLMPTRSDRRNEDVTLLRVYHQGRGMALSDVLPLLENVGYRVLEQVSYVVRTGGAERGIEVFKVLDPSGAPIDVASAGARLVHATETLLRGHGENDRLNRLVMTGGLSLREVTVLRALLAQYVQISAVTSRRFVIDTLLAHPSLARALHEVFRLKFDPDLDVDGPEDRAARLAASRDAFVDALAGVDSLPEDTLLRGLLNLVDAAVRTNAYAPRRAPAPTSGAPAAGAADAGTVHADATPPESERPLAIKYRSADIASMPSPRPLFEITVVSPDVEGSHLRGGTVARGGIRWSDRPDDFRTEVLGLMKTQMTKNAVIVPVGSKGGFVVKRPPPERDALRTYVQECYRAFVGSLLDVTDTMDGDRVVHPDGVLVYDDPDPYLVVAADKGTATFSDLANAIAERYGFWLGDAFASGGSHGYDHKEEGITARGAWEAVKRHFRELGRDPLREPFTAVGIGDMSGDVFGNGMRYSRHIRLVAAFNHQHVMIDPDPDPERSYAERERLFRLPRSTWRDFDTSVLSEGGGVFDRAAKRIALTPQIKDLLQTHEDALSGEALVRAVLTLGVDLLWNGGIGTYVKAEGERHADVGDASNDAVRVDASDLRCRVVGEGGNLGFTQLARIEYARAGGRINTDAIDNVGGVNLSDHEVNLKLLFQPLVVTGELSRPRRDRLLADMTDEVAEQVLQDTARQALALSLAERRSRDDVLLFESLQDYLAERGDLDPQVEALPSRRSYAERERAGEGLTRPELAVLMAYVKMGLYRRLLETEVPSERALEHYLVDYFPGPVQERFGDAIRRHPLRREIAATRMTNTVVDLLGPTFVHRMLRDTGATPVEAIRAALIALELLDVEDVYRRVDALPPQVPSDAAYDVLQEQLGAVDGLVRWMLLNDLSGAPVERFAELYRAPLAQLRADLHDLLPLPQRRLMRRAVKRATAAGIDAALANEAATFEYVPSAMGAIEVARRTGLTLHEAARRFYRLGDRLSLGWLRDRLAERRPADRWEVIATGGLVMDLREAQQDLAERYVRAVQDDSGRLSPDAFLMRYPNVMRRYDEAVHDLRADGEVSLAAAGVLVRLLEQIVDS